MRHALIGSLRKSVVSAAAPRRGDVPRGHAAGRADEPPEQPPQRPLAVLPLGGRRLGGGRAVGARRRSGDAHAGPRELRLGAPRRGGEEAGAEPARAGQTVHAVLQVHQRQQQRRGDPPGRSGPSAGQPARGAAGLAGGQVGRALPNRRQCWDGVATSSRQLGGSCDKPVTTGGARRTQSLAPGRKAFGRGVPTTCVSSRGGDSSAGLQRGGRNQRW
mmetsp:Transcript_45901/g.147444  ORF Transcript_45901/g.147444 Transcript_45901/m.147444 type:complete len:217 (-) Transcript_45901:1036-1686(-)